MALSREAKNKYRFRLLSLMDSSMPMRKTEGGEGGKRAKKEGGKRRRKKRKR